MDRFLQSQDVKPQSRDVYRRQLKPFFEWAESHPRAAWDRLAILDYKASLHERHLSPYTISNYLVLVRKFFEWADAEGLSRNIAKGVKGASRPRGFAKDVITASQAFDLLAAMPRQSVLGLRDYAIVNLLLRTGLRTIEVTRADVSDIRRQGTDWVLWVQRKGHAAKDEFVVLTPAALKPIQRYHTLAGIGRMAAAPLFQAASDNRRGGRLSTRTVSGIVKGALMQVGLTSRRLSAHSLRHSAVTFALQAGASLQEAQAMAGHVNIATTTIYAHNLERLKSAPEKKIDGFLKKIV